MLAHMLMNSIQILEETHMAKLIYLIMTDGLNRQLLSDILQVIGEAAMQATPEPGKVILEVEQNLYTISGFPALLTLSENLNQEILIIIVEMMHTVSVIPVYTEIFRRRL